LESSFYRRCFQIATAAILAYLLYRVLEPLSGMLGWAVVLAFVLYPLHVRLSRRLKGRRALSAGILTLLTPFVVLAPLAVLTGRWRASSNTSAPTARHRSRSCSTSSPATR
jgi:predicted PurR-regulated permease PerM